MKRGDVWWVNFDPSAGGEIRKQRPAIVVSNDASNKHLNRLQVVPLSSRTGRVFPSEAAILLEGKRSKAMADQLTTVSKARVLDRAGRITVREMKLVEAAICRQLGLTRPD